MCVHKSEKEVLSNFRVRETVGTWK